MAGDNVKVVYASGSNPIVRGIKYFMRGRRGRAFILRHLLRAVPGLNNALLQVGDVLIPLDLTLDADIGYFYDEGIGHEEFYQQVLLALVDQDTVFYDVGANLGYYSFLLVSRVMWVCSIEPNPEMAGRILEVVRGHGIKGMEVLPIGIGNEAGRLDYYYQAGKHNLGSFDSKGSDSLSIKVDVDTMDGILASEQRPRPTVLKIDTEGYEMNILKGYVGLLSHRPVVVMEWIPGRDDAASNWDDLLAYVSEVYDIFKVGHMPSLVPVHNLSFTNYSNLLLLPKGSDARNRIVRWISA